MTNQKNKTYKVLIYCQNCNYGHADMSMYDGEFISILLGKKVKDILCPKCHCKTLIQLDNKWREKELS